MQFKKNPKPTAACRLGCLLVLLRIKHEVSGLFGHRAPSGGPLCVTHLSLANTKHFPNSSGTPTLVAHQQPLCSLKTDACCCLPPCFSTSTGKGREK